MGRIEDAGRRVGLAALAIVVTTAPLLLPAHPGRVDRDGCHTCRTRCGRWGLVAGERHCHGGPTPPARVEPDHAEPVFTAGSGGPGRPSPLVFQSILADRASQPCTALPDAPASSDGLRLAFWNAKRLGHGTKDLATLLHVIDDFDLVALAEVMRSEIVGDVVHLLGADEWGALISPAIGRSSYRERYAVLFRRAAVAPSSAGHALYGDPGDRFAREPMLAGFRAGSFDFTLAIAHVTWGQRRDRTDEVDGLAGAFGDVQDGDPAEQDVVLVGDFNVEPRDRAWSRLLGLPGITLLLAPPLRTTLGRRGLASLYDNVIVQRHHTSEWTGRAGSIDTTRLYAGDLGSTGSRLSDHLPVWATFRTDGPDDD